jgi:hypothetical protein
MKKLSKTPKNRLTHAGKRRTTTLKSVMIKIPYKGRYIECSNASEAIEVLKHIDAEEKHSTRRSFHVAEGGDSGTFPWTRELFVKFVESLGTSQKEILGLLVHKHKVTDEELRKALKLDGNQALAGVLSGISKQAGILNISARSVYTVEDERKAGTLSKTYVAANEFMQMAKDMNWPEE